MKKFYFITWIILFTGFIFRFLHFEGGGVLLSLSGLLIVIHCIIHLIKFARLNLSLSMLYSSIAVITIYLIGRILYFSFVKPIFPVACLLAWTCLTVHIVKRTRFHFSQALLIIYFAFFYAISYTPSYEIYYFVNLNTFLNKDSRNTDYRSWDNYSWYLNLRKKQTEALEANIKATDAVKLLFKNSNNDEARQYLTVLKQHEQLIRSKDNSEEWLGYDEINP